MYSPSIQKLIQIFSKFPTVGPKTAARFVFYLMKLPREEVEGITRTILDLKKNVKLCEFCFNHFEPGVAGLIQQRNLCDICSDKKRDKSLLCIVEKEQDLAVIESAKTYRGLYFILGGTMPAIKGAKDDGVKTRVEELQKRIENPQDLSIATPGFKEIIIATNPTTEGETTMLYLQRILKPMEDKIKITRLGRGLPIGGELEYADEETINSALEGRR